MKSNMSTSSGCALGALAFSLSLVNPVWVAAAAGTPDFNGVWQVITPVIQLKTSDGKAPPLTAAAQKVYGERLAKFKAGKAKDYDPTLQSCKPMGAPRNSYDGSLPSEIQPFEIQQGESKLMFGYTFNRTERFVDIKPKFGDIAGPTYYGTWIAKWQGQTLVMTGKMLNEGTLLDAAGMPHSEALEVTERLTLKDSNTLVSTLSFQDPATFTKAWKTTVTYKKLPAGTRIQEDFCLERLNITLKSAVAG